jgi:hypothetical protein
MTPDAKTTKITLGFFGGAIPLRVSDAELAALRDALKNGEWHDITTDEGTVTVNLGVVVYLNVESAERGVGFS